MDNLPSISDEVKLHGIQPDPPKVHGIDPLSDIELVDFVDRYISKLKTVTVIMEIHAAGETFDVRLMSEMRPCNWADSFRKWLKGLALYVDRVSAEQGCVIIWTQTVPWSEADEDIRPEAAGSGESAAGDAKCLG